MLFKNLSTQKVWEVTNPDRIEELKVSNEYQEIKQETKPEIKKEIKQEAKAEETSTKAPDKKSKTKA